MKNQLITLSFLCILLILSSCGEDSCDQQEWIGTWELQGEDSCESGDTTHFPDDILVFEAGSSEDMISLSGNEFQLNENKCSFTEDSITLEISGNQLTLDYGDNCIFMYNKK